MLLLNLNIPFDRAHQAVSGTQQFIVGTVDWANISEKNSNLSLTSLTWFSSVFYKKDLFLTSSTSKRMYHF